ncbi:MAG TPA: ATP-binding cassette domain-containing protein [Micromonosporaceae bacterium]
MSVASGAAAVAVRDRGGDGVGIEVSCRGLVYIYRLEGYDVVALAGVDLDIAAGESVALLGPSGSGKSTLLSVLAGLLKPSAGRLVVGEHDLARAAPAELAAMRAGSVGVVLQGAWRNLLPYLSAEQNVRFAQRGAGSGRRRSLPSPREVLHLVGLSGRNRTRMRPHELTPGERQRLALAVALANRPGLLLADEPTSQLDSRARDEVLGALDSVRQSGTTVVVVTHDPVVARQMSRTVTIRDGRVGAEGRRGEDYAVVGRDGTVHLPPEALAVFVPGSFVEVLLEPDGTARLVPVGLATGAAGVASAAGPMAGVAGAASGAVAAQRGYPPAQPTWPDPAQPARAEAGRAELARDEYARAERSRAEAYPGQPAGADHGQSAKPKSDLAARLAASADQDPAGFDYWGTR